MFWTNHYVVSPRLEALLAKEDVTLHEVLDQEDIVQECKTQNKKLVEYLTRPDVLEELVMLTTREPSSEVEERCRYKYPNVACELLTCEVPTLNEKLAADHSLLGKLYSFIDTEQPLNPLLASFFSKTIGVLIARKPDQNWYSYQFSCLQVLEFLQSRQRCVDLLLRHLETSAIMDLILKLVTQVEGGDMRRNILNWLDEQRLVQRLAKLLSPASDASRHANSADLLCDMVRAAREHRVISTERNDPDPILDTLESTHTVSLILETILSGEKVESSIVGGIQVLLALLGHKIKSLSTDETMHDAEEDANQQEQCIKISNATVPYLPQLHDLLLNPPRKPAVKTTAGTLNFPFGNTRLHVAKLLVALLSTENLKVYEKLIELGTFQVLLDLFFEYSWNNFLHTQVQRCMALAVRYDHQDSGHLVYSNIFVKCRLIERILEAWQKNEGDRNSESSTVRQGYMGHLIDIANNVATQCEEGGSLLPFLKANLPAETLEQWEKLASVELVRINQLRSVTLETQDQNQSNVEEDPSKFLNYAQTMYAKYQDQRMTPLCDERFGHHDDEFNDGRDSFPDPLERVQSHLNEDSFLEKDLDFKEHMFMKVCQQKQKAGLEDSGGSGEWGDDADLTFQTVIEKADWPSEAQRRDSSSSDEYVEEPRDVLADADNGDNGDLWDNADPVPLEAPLPLVDPWQVDAPVELESTGWAKFDVFNSERQNEDVAADNKATNKTEQTEQAERTAEKAAEMETVNQTEASNLSTSDANEFKLTNDALINEGGATVVANLVNTADDNANPSETGTTVQRNDSNEKTTISAETPDIESSK